MSVRSPDAKLNVRLADISVSTETNGPGRRLVFWFQGCPIRCKGCINSYMWNPKGGELVPLEKLYHLMRTLRERIEGVTFTGGEPLYQPDLLISLMKMAKKLGLTIVTYTGYTLDLLSSGAVPRGREVLKYTDILIDGPFIEELAGNYRWRGSSNQRILLLSEAYSYLGEKLEGGSQIELRVGGGVSITGIFSEDFWRAFMRNLGQEW